MKGWKAAEKTYLAIVEGCPEPAEGTIDQPLRLDPVIYQMHVGPHPAASTKYEPTWHGWDTRSQATNDTAQSVREWACTPCG